MNAATYRLLAELLRRAADEFVCHGCNDFNVAAIMPDVEDRRQLRQQMEAENGTPEEYDPTKDYTAALDWWLMAYFAAYFEAEAAKLAPGTVPP